MEHEGYSDPSHSWSSQNNVKEPRKKLWKHEIRGRIEITAEISQNTEKNPGELRGLAVA